MKTKLILLLICMGLGIPSFAVSFTDGNFKFNTLSDDECEVTGTTLTSGALNIPATATYNGKTLKVTSIGDHAFDGCSGFTGSLALPEGLISIGDYAFDGCRGFNGSLTLPEGLTNIGQRAFRYCTGFTGELSIPNSVTNIGISAFNGCSSFAGELKLPEELTNMGIRAFADCRGFTGELKLPEGLTSIGEQTFYGCSGFTGSLVIPAGITSIGESAFRGCSGFTSDLKLPEDLTTLDDYAFWGCSGFTGSLVIPAGITSIGESAFDGCSGLTELHLPPSLKKIGRRAFYYTNFSLITCEATTPPTLGKFLNGEYYNTFYTYPQPLYKQPLYVPAESVSLYKSATEWKDFKNINAIGKEVENISLDKSEITIAIGMAASLTVTVSPEDAAVKTVTWKSSNESIATVDENGKVTAKGIGNATITVTTVDGSNRSARCTVTVVPRQETVGNFIYEIIPGKDGEDDSVKVIGGNPDSDGTLEIPSEVEIDGKKYPVTEIGDGAFKGREDITKVIIPESVVKVGDESFASCPNLKEVVTEDGDETLAFGSNVFAGSPIETVYDGRNSTGTPFAGNTSLTDLTIGEKVSGLAPGEFAGCPNIKEVTVLNPVPPTVGAGAFDKAVYDNAVLRVPDGSVDDYKAAEDWKDFFKILGINEVEVLAIAINLDELTLQEGSAEQLTATITPDNATAKSVTWSSSDEAVATVDATGKVTAIAAGNATITATSANALTATCAVTVTAKPSGIEGIDAGSDGVRVEGNSIIAPEGSEVFDLSGRKVRATELRRGVYIVRVPSGKAVKVMVR